MNRKSGHDYKRFYNNAKQKKIGNINMFFGEEDFLIDWASQEIKRKFVNPATLLMDYEVLSAPSVDEIISKCETYPVLSEKRVVRVKNFDAAAGKTKVYKKKDVERLKKYLKNINSETILIFSLSGGVEKKSAMWKFLSKNADCYEFKPLDRRTFENFVLTRLKREGKVISRENMKYLVEKTGYFTKENNYDLFRLENDISKMTALSEKEISSKNIEDTVCSEADRFIFSLLDYIVDGKKGKALKMLGDIYSEGASFNLIGRIASQYELLLGVRELQDDGCPSYKIAETLGASKYRIEKLMPYARRRKASEIRENLSSIYQVPGNIRKGLLDGRLALELFISGL